MAKKSTAKKASTKSASVKKAKTKKPETPAPQPIPGFSSLSLRPLFEELWEIEAAATLASKHTGFLPIDRLTSMWYTFVCKFDNVCAQYSASVPSSLTDRSVPEDVASLLQRIEEALSELPGWCRAFNIAVPQPQKGQVHVEK